MSLIENVKACFRNHNRFVNVLRKIADESTDTEVARLAREVLSECGIETKKGPRLCPKESRS